MGIVLCAAASAGGFRSRYAQDPPPSCPNTLHVASVSQGEIRVQELPQGQEPPEPGRVTSWTLPQAGHSAAVAMAPGWQ